MKEYEIIIDYESKHLVVEAENEEEAREKGYQQAIKIEEMPDCWVAEYEEVKEE